MGLVKRARRRMRRSLGNAWRWAKSPKKAATRARRWKAMWKVAKKKVKNAAERRARQAWDQRRRIYRRRYRKQERRARREDKGAEQGKIVVSPGSPHWGGSDDILELEVEPIARRYGLEPNSAKRSACYGNCSSDHHISQVNASARDFPTASNYALAQEIRSQLAGGTHRDYENFYFTREGRTYRGQIIAGTHGTGPHLHVGIELVG